jgi:hypothetical protein
MIPENEGVRGVKAVHEVLSQKSRCGETRTSPDGDVLELLQDRCVPRSTLQDDPREAATHPIELRQTQEGRAQEA